MDDDSGGVTGKLRFITASILLRCEHCGGGLPVQGPLRKVPCPACQKLNSLGAGRIVEYLKRIADGSSGFLSSREGEVRFGHHDFHPCGECGAEVPLEALALGDESATPCPKCAAPVESFPAPPWLAEELPGVVQLYGAAREPGDRPANALPLPAPKAVAPVVMQCPKCSAALELNAESRRTTMCTYCQANVYLPDDLWRLLHPVETTRLWTWASRGPLKSKHELRGEENERRHRAQEEQQEAEEKAKRDQQAAQQHFSEQRAAAKERRNKVLFIALVVAAIAAYLVGGRLGYWQVPDFSGSEYADPRDTGWVG
jgi:hypothetical protein